MGRVPVDTDQNPNTFKQSKSETRSVAELAARESVRNEDAARDTMLAELRQERAASDASATVASTAPAVAPTGPAAQTPPVNDGLDRGAVLSPADWAAKRFPKLSQFQVLPMQAIQALDQGYAQYLDQIDREHGGRLDTSRERQRIRNQDSLVADRIQGQEQATRRNDLIANRDRQTALDEGRRSELFESRNAATVTNQEQLRQAAADRLAETNRHNLATEANGALEGSSELNKLRDAAIRELEAGPAGAAYERYQAIRSPSSVDLGQPRRSFSEALLGDEMFSEKTGKMVTITEGILPLAEGGPKEWLRAFDMSRRLDQAGTSPRQHARLVSILESGVPTIEEAIKARDDGVLSDEELDRIAAIIDPQGRRRALAPTAQPAEKDPGRFFLRVP